MQIKDMEGHEEKLKRRIMLALSSIYEQRENYITYENEYNGVLLNAKISHNTYERLNYIYNVYEAYIMIDAIVASYLRDDSSDENSLAVVINSHMIEDNEKSKILGIAEFMFNNKFTLWIGQDRDGVVEQQFASTAYVVREDLVYQAFTSWYEVNYHVRENSINEIKFLYDLIDNFTKDDFRNDLMYKLNTALICNDIGYYVDDIIEIVYGAIYVANKVNKKLLESEGKILGFGKIEEGVTEVKSLEISLLNRVLEDPRLFSLLVRLYQLVPRCHIVNVINDVGENLTVLGKYRDLVYEYRPEEEDEESVIPVKNYNALYLLYLRDPIFNRDVNDIMNIENSEDWLESVENIIISYNLLIS